MTFTWHGKAYGTNKRLETTRSGGIYKNPGYEGFQDGLVWSMVRNRGTVQPIKGPVYVDMLFAISKSRDIDSLIKPVLDCLQTARIIKNDNQVISLTAMKKTKVRGKDDEIRIEVTEVLQ